MHAVYALGASVSSTGWTPVALAQIHWWWRHQMETFSALLCGEFTSHRWIPLTKASDAELWCFFFFYLRLNKRLSKQSRRWWFETPSLTVISMQCRENYCSVTVLKGYICVIRPSWVINSLGIATIAWWAIDWQVYPGATDCGRGWHASHAQFHMKMSCHVNNAF